VAVSRHNGGRRGWAHFEFTRINITPTILHKKIGSTALLVWAYVRYGRRNPTVAVPLAIGVLSHVMLDIIHHEPDIALLPIASSPRIGFGLATKPVVDLRISPRRPRTEQLSQPLATRLVNSAARSSKSLRW
jgi:hypothetical protein